MGIYDRDYVRNPQGRGRAGARRVGGGGWGGAGGGGGGMGLQARARMVSVTGWLIAINIAVFIIGGFLISNGVPVYVSDSYFQQSTGPGVTQTGVYTDRGVSYDGLVPPQQNRIVLPLLDDSGRVQQTWVFTRLSDARVRDARPGNFIHQPIYETDDQGRPARIVGLKTFRVMDPLAAFGHFSTKKGFLELGVWRLVTFQFLHSSLSHLLLNMVGLWVFGLQVEQQLGRKRYLAFYLTCGICGGLLYLFLNIAAAVGINLPGALHVEITTPLIGASAGVFGVLMACAFLVPNERIRLILLPIAFKTKYFAYGYFLLAVFNLFVLKGTNQGGDAAHVGGALAGFFFIRRPHLLRDFFDVFQDSRKPQTRRSRPGKKSGGHEKKLDDILDKVHREGVQSLTERERKFLQKFSPPDDDRLRP